VKGKEFLEHPNVLARISNLSAGMLIGTIKDLL
jgi:hypothetical protein